MYLKVIISCFWLILCGVMLTSCATKNQSLKQNTSTSLQVLIKSPLLRINDAAFIHSDKNGILIQIYNLAQPILKLELKNKICVNSVCYERSNFNKKFFGYEYYERLIDEIISFSPIFNAKNKHQNNCGGFNQNIQNISYEICADKATFNTENVKIVLKKL